MRKFTFRLSIYIVFFLSLQSSQSLYAQYGWPMGQTPNQQQILTSTFMEYRPGRFHVGIDIVPNNTIYDQVYNVKPGYVDEIESHGPPNEHNERILVGDIDGEFSYIHVDVNNLLYEGQYLDLVDTYLGDWYSPNPTGLHLHFEEGGQFFYDYAYNPLACNIGISPYVDNTNPSISNIRFYRQPSGASLNNNNLNGNVDIRVTCNDPVGNFFGAVYVCGAHGCIVQKVIHHRTVMIDRMRSFCQHRPGVLI